MARNLKFPNPRNTPRLKAEDDQRIVIANAITVITAGGATGGQLGAWKKAFPAAVYSQFVLEIMGSVQMTLNDGTINSAIGLYGNFLDEAGSNERFLLGIVGYNLGATMPQVRIHSNVVGFAQVINIATVYDSISLGGVFANVTVPGAGPTITATLRPVMERDYGG